MPTSRDLFHLASALRSAGKEIPLNTREKKDLAKANVWIMDVEMDDGRLPPEIESLSNLQRPLKPSEQRKILEWYYQTAPGDY